MPSYIGRFAPSPTGPLHMGSLLAALISYLDAKANNGKWLLRIEDIDPPREIPGAADHIRSSLASHGLEWDGEVLYQSSRSQAYEQNLQILLDQGYCYFCPCSRKDLLEQDGEHLPNCGIHSSQLHADAAIRFRSSTATAHWEDLFFGPQRMAIGEDFVLKRRDGLYAYQLAVVSDDIYQDVSHILRGADLLESTPIQLLIYEALNARPPSLGHFPLVINRENQKLSKQNLAPAIKSDDALNNLQQCASWLNIPLQVGYCSPREMLDDLVQKWDRKQVQQHPFHSE